MGWRADWKWPCPFQSLKGELLALVAAMGHIRPSSVPLFVRPLRHHMHVGSAAVAPRAALWKRVVVHMRPLCPAKPPGVAAGAVESEHPMNIQALVAPAPQREVVRQHLPPAPGLQALRLAIGADQHIVVKNIGLALISPAGLEEIAPLQASRLRNNSFRATGGHGSGVGNEQTQP